ncbi:delta(3,5)-Delta(2,4)-dienoyl-CoA isomerase, mitochondrial isoform X1 [Aplysia californica]|uniref:Delta(3,5)-Delta(2,4)-dienoyl-CoA isomerase, mitochondrial isoform X1 n=1 Tax=Aplysia californica TaxID=6500 RepID=A0ABM0JT82_APLCA|nr:delta(3,5)-Delta(2,4)-dienoyl-CoA isomerase, mitochondrial isoform X1 [Aplysia californica]
MFSRTLNQTHQLSKSLGTFVAGEVKGVPSKKSLVARTMSSQATYEFETLKVTSPEEYVKHVELNRPKKLNAMNTAFWNDMIDCFRKLAVDPECRVVILSGAGRMFTAGLDLYDNENQKDLAEAGDPSRKAIIIQRFLPKLQEAFNVMERCNKPVIAAIHNACIGGGIDMASATDIRYCTSDAWFQIKEIDIGLAADLGTLQRFPKIIGNDSLCRELVYTARKFTPEEAKHMGFISRIFPDKDAMMAASIELAKTIASKSPVAVQGSKVNLVYSRDHTVQEGLDYMVTWNSAMLQSEDTAKAVMGMMAKETPIFSKL